MNTFSDKKINLTANILFSGIGCQERGFENSGLYNFEVLNTSDICKESVVAYAAVHCGLTDEMVETYTEYPSREEMVKHLENINLGYIPEKNKKFDWNKLIKKKTKELEKYWLACKLSNNLGDISKIEELPYADFWTCSFPCTDISVAGNMKGFDPDSGTRSSLLWENVRLLKKAKENNTLPKYIMVENVKNLVSKKFIGNFNELISVLDDIGFNTYWSVLNGKDCGVPQNRERVFVVAIRKDIDTGKFEFPVPFDNGLRLKDVLEDEVDDEYYLTQEAVSKFRYKESGDICKQIGWLKKSDDGIEHQSNAVYSTDGYARTLVAVEHKAPLKIMKSPDNNFVKERFFKQALDTLQNSDVEVGDTIDAFNQRVNKSGYSPTITTRPEGFKTAILPVVEGNEKKPHSEWKEEMFSKFVEDSDGEISGVYTNQSQTFGYRPPLKGISKTLKANANDTGVVDGIKIRKLTPKECWILMGFEPEDCDKVANVGIAKSHLYKMAGNGIITNCVELIAEHLYKAQYDESYVCTDENFTKPQVD